MEMGLSFKSGDLWSHHKWEGRRIAVRFYRSTDGTAQMCDHEELQQWCCHTISVDTSDFFFIAKNKSVITQITHMYWLTYVIIYFIYTCHFKPYVCDSPHPPLITFYGSWPSSCFPSRRCFSRVDGPPRSLRSHLFLRFVCVLWTGTLEHSKASPSFLTVFSLQKLPFWPWDVAGIQGSFL